MALPALIYFIVYCYAPMAGLYIAVSDFKISGGLFDGKFVGLKYLMDFFHSYYFGRLQRLTDLLQFFDYVVRNIQRGTTDGAGGKRDALIGHLIPPIVQGQQAVLCNYHTIAPFVTKIVTKIIIS